MIIEIERRGSEMIYRWRLPSQGTPLFYSGFAGTAEGGGTLTGPWLKWALLMPMGASPGEPMLRSSLLRAGFGSRWLRAADGDGARCELPSSSPM